jgi:hypothetical protein
MSSILTIIHIVFSLFAIGSGTVVLFGLLTGKLFGKWALIFLECSLITSVIGLFLPFHPLQGLTPTQTTFMLSVYVAGVAVLAWRKYHLAGTWRSIFALTATIVLYLNSVAFLALVFKLVSHSRMQAFSRPGPTLIIMQFLFMALFAVLGILAARKFQNRPAGSF